MNGIYGARLISPAAFRADQPTRAQVDSGQPRLHHRAMIASVVVISGSAMVSTGASSSTISSRAIVAEGMAKTVEVARAEAIMVPPKWCTAVAPVAPWLP
jgi:hypothetical protein